MNIIARFKENSTQLLKQHLKNVSFHCAEFSNNIGLESCGLLCGMLHDLGKYSPDFQEYICAAKLHTEQETYDSWIRSIKKVDHSVYGAKYLYQNFGNTSGFTKLTCDILMEVICYHHGGLPNNLNQKNEVPILLRLDSIDEESLSLVVQQMQQDFPTFNMEQQFYACVKEIEQIYSLFSDHGKHQLGFLIKYLYSCLVDADRLDSYLFESKQTLNTIDTQPLWSQYLTQLEHTLRSFETVIPQTPLEKSVKQMRSYVSNCCTDFATQKTGIYSLTVPTGGGKTLASLRFALHHALEHKQTKIIYILPYTTIIEQNAEEIRNILDCKDHLLEFHSNIIDETQNEEYKLLSERFSSPIIFTTMVQFLNSLFATKNGNIRRMHQYDHAILIFDEIQALPLKCTALFYSAIEFLSKIGHTTSILCTATQPSYAYISKMLPLHIDGEIIPDTEKVFQNLRRMQVIDKTQAPMSLASVSEFIITLHQTSNSILCITNTVQSAITLYDLVNSSCDKDTELHVLTSRMCPKHRQETIHHIKQSLYNKHRVICISTQLIEAGVDISFENVIRSLANLDSISQAAGRGNRHGERTLSNIYVVDLEEEVLPSLSDIKIGQSHTRNILYTYQKHPEIFHNDLLSPKAISSYYQQFYTDEKINQTMVYPIDDAVETSLFNLLENSKARLKRNVSSKFFYSYQFEYARTRFQVIDSHTKTIIVPYNDEAKDAIGILLCQSFIGEKYTALKRLQIYSISIYENIYRDLQKKNAFIHTELEGVLVLSDEYYHYNKGVTGEKKLHLTIF